MSASVLLFVASETGKCDIMSLLGNKDGRKFCLEIYLLLLSWTVKKVHKTESRGKKTLNMLTVDHRTFKRILRICLSNTGLKIQLFNNRFTVSQVYSLPTW